MSWQSAAELTDIESIKEMLDARGVGYRLESASFSSPAFNAVLLHRAMFIEDEEQTVLLFSGDEDTSPLFAITDCAGKRYAARADFRVDPGEFIREHLPPLLAR